VNALEAVDTLEAVDALEAVEVDAVEAVEVDSSGLSAPGTCHYEPIRSLSS
jgi:hypothetical protein